MEFSDEERLLFMNKKWLVMGTAVALAAMGSVASARNIANGEQKGSLLVWPYVSAADGNKTIISITNDGANNTDKEIKCYFQDSNKNKVDRVFFLTKTDTLSIDIAEEWTLPEPKGMIACWVIKESEAPDVPDQQIVWNHLFGKANVVNFQNGTAFEYRAWAFRALGTQNAPVGTPGEIKLDGTAYEYCPQTLLGEFTPPAHPADNGSGSWVAKHLLVTASCDLDLRQDANFLATKLDFSIYNAEEVLRSGTWECSDSWHETYLGYPNSPPVSSNFPARWPNGWEYRYAALENWKINTEYGYFRVTSTASNQCDANLKLGGSVKAKKVGLVGVLVNEITFGTGGLQAKSASDLSMSGQYEGTILYDGGTGPDEKN
jgi:hypothetical protein